MFSSMAGTKDVKNRCNPPGSNLRMSMIVCRSLPRPTSLPTVAPDEDASGTCP